MKLTQQMVSRMQVWQTLMKEPHNWLRLLADGLYWLYGVVTPLPYDGELTTTNLGFPYFILTSGTTVVSFYHHIYDQQKCTLIDILFRPKRGKGGSKTFFGSSQLQRIQYLADPDLPIETFPEDLMVGVWYKPHIDCMEAMARWKESGKIKQCNFRNFIIDHVYSNGSLYLQSETSVCRRQWNSKKDCDLRNRIGFQESDGTEGLTEMDWLFFTQWKTSRSFRDVLEEFNTFLEENKMDPEKDYVPETLQEIMERKYKYLKSAIHQVISATK